MRRRLAGLMAALLVVPVAACGGDESSSDDGYGGGTGSDDDSSFCWDQGSMYSEMHASGDLSDEDYDVMVREIEEVCE